MGDLFGALQNASAAAPRTMPCFNGFGLPLCTQQAADKNGYSGSGWTPAMPHKYDVRDAMLCLQCCSSGHEFYDALDDRWSLRCRTGNWDVTVPAQWAAGQPLKLLNPFTKVPTRVPVPAGKGPGSMFRIVVGAMPPLSQYDRWEFRFLKREEEGDGATLVSCPLQRANRSRYVAGYTLRLTVNERRRGVATWQGVDACSATALESALPPAFTTETVLMSSSVAPLSSSSIVGVFFVMAAIGSMCAWVICPARVRALRKQCRERGQSQLTKLRKGV